MAYSLRKRLLFLASCVLLIGFSVSGWILDSAYRHGLVAATQEKLQLQILTLLSLADEYEQQLNLPENLPAPRLNQPSSGLYALVLNKDGEEVWRSNSAVAVDFPFIHPLSVGEKLFQQVQIQQQGYFVAGLGTVWTIAEQDKQFSFFVIEDQLEFQQTSQEFRTTLFSLWFALLAIMLILQWTVLRHGLLPLKSIAKELHQVEQGKSTQLADNYPIELQPLMNSINQLIKSEQNQRQRYKDRMADLAHSLKTPLAILSSLDSKNAKHDKQLIQQQVKRMVNIVDYQLQRAVLGNQTLTFQHVNIAKVIKQINTALKKVYQDKQVNCELNLDDSIHFRGDESDITEIVANLMDNAFKYGAGIVRVSLFRDDDNNTIISVEDNGSGMSSNTLEKVIARGTRLDSQQQGQGIGMAVVAELVAHYQGKLTVADSELLGAHFQVTFP